MDDTGETGPSGEDEEEEAFNPDVFVEKTMELARTHRERIKGIIMNIPELQHHSKR